MVVDTWYHIALTCDVSQPSATTFELYLNTTSQGNGTSILSANPSAISDNTTAFCVGCGLNNGVPLRFFDGLIDDIRVWNDIRTSSEISANYQRELAGNEANLQGYWKLNNNYLDQTTNDNDLTPSGTPVFSTDVPFADSTTTSTSTTSTSSSTTTTTSSSTSTSTSTTGTNTSTSTTTTSTSTTTTSTSTTSTSTSTTSTSTTLDLKFTVEQG